MGAVYAAADIVVCRAGAMTVAELAAAGVPSVLVPLPGAPDDHQTANARVLERAGAAILLPDADCDAAGLDSTLGGMLVDPAGLDAMGRAASGLGRPDAAAAGARVVEANARPEGAEVAAMTGVPGTAALIDPTRPVTVHVVGIGGAGMSAIATALAAMGHRVTGSDLKASGVTDRLRRNGIGVAIGHSGDNVGSADLVAVSSAVGPGNPEVAEARRRGITVVARSEALAAIASLRRCIAVAGTHGKTTTASMLALLLVEAGIHPSFLIGGEVNEIGTNAVWDEGEWLVVEADESDGTFLALVPDIAVVTNVEPDHLDHYGSFAAVRSAFDEFAARARHRRVVGGDDPEAARIGRATGADLVGTTPECTYRMVDVDLARSSVSFGLAGPDGRGAGPAGRARPGPPQRQERRHGHGGRPGRRGPVPGRRPGAGPLRRGRPAVRVPGHGQRGHLRRRLRPPAIGGPGRPGGGAQRRLAPGGRRLPAPPLQPHVGAVGRIRRRHSPTPTSSWSPTSTGRASHRCPACPANWSPTPSAGRPPTIPVAYVSGRADLRRAVRDLLEAGDLCCTLGAGDLTSLPDELMSDPGW